MPSITENVNDKHLRPILRDLFSQLNEGQQGKFKRIYKSVDVMSAEKIPWAIAICERTIKGNQEVAP